MERKYDQSQALVERLRGNLEDKENRLTESQAGVKAGKKALEAESNEKKQVITEKERVDKELAEALERLRLAGQGGTEREAVMAALEGKLAALHKSVKEATAEVDNLRRELKLSQDATAEANREIAAGEERLKAAQEDLVRREGAMQGVLFELGEAKSEIMVLKEKESRLQRQVVELEATSASAMKRAKEAELSRDRLQDELQGKTTALQEALQQVTELREQLDGAMKRWDKAQDELKEKDLALEEAKKGFQKELERVRNLARAQVHVVVSAPCVKLNINDQKHAFKATRNDVAAKVSEVLQSQLLPKYLAIFTCEDKSVGEQDADKHASQFIKDMSKEINEKIVPMLYEDLGDNMELIDRSNGKLLNKSNKENAPKDKMKSAVKKASSVRAAANAARAGNK